METVQMIAKSTLRLLGCLVLGSFLTSIPARAAERLAVAQIFGNHMVLQQGAPVSVWGVAKAGAVVQVSFGGQNVKATARKDGQWRVVLDSLKASTTPREMSVSSEAAKLKFGDVLVGDVWICAGQSNMQFKLGSCTNAEAEIAAAKHPRLRLNMGKTWQVSSPASVKSFSGVAYFFGRKLQTDTGTPVGLIARALGGTPIEWWTPAEKLTRVPFAKTTMEQPSEKWVKYGQAVAEWQAKRKQDRKSAGRKPIPVGSAEELVLASIYAPKKPGSLFTKHLAPMAGFRIRGAIWYQGERNSKAGTKAATAYQALLVNIIMSWRESWGQGDFPFLAVQLPPYSKGGPSWAIVQKAQAAAVGEVANATYIDLQDQPDDGLHPKNKKPVGERLAQTALEKFLTH
jgi:sialate O-acetylesterase